MDSRLDHQAGRERCDQPPPVRLRLLRLNPGPALLGKTQLLMIALAFVRGVNTLLEMAWLQEKEMAEYLQENSQLKPPVQWSEDEF